MTGLNTTADNGSLSCPQMKVHRPLGTLYRAAAFDVMSYSFYLLYSILFVGNERQESSKFYSDLRNTNSLEPTIKCYFINWHCSAVTMTIKLSSYMTWSTSEKVASIQLPLNSVFFHLVEGST